MDPRRIAGLPSGYKRIMLAVPDAIEDLQIAPPRLRLVVPRRDVPLVSLRTCAKCGEYTAFVREGNESWYVCAACGRYA